MFDYVKTLNSIKESNNRIVIITNILLYYKYFHVFGPRWTTLIDIPQLPYIYKSQGQHCKLAGSHYTSNLREPAEQNIGQYTSIVNLNSAQIQWFTVSIIGVTWPRCVPLLLPYTATSGMVLAAVLITYISPSHYCSVATSLRQPSPIEMPSLQGPSPSSCCRHRIKALEITLLCSNGASIGLGQRTLNCNFSIVEKKKVNWAHQSAQLDKLLLVVIFQILLSPSHI